jgi:hypothetical protein
MPRDAEGLLAAKIVPADPGNVNYQLGRSRRKIE